jgi:hypothetical protein
MSNNIVEELPARKHAPVAAAPAKKDAAPAKGGQSVPKGGDSDEASAKRIRQAVYDIRYRAKKDKITLQAAFSSYMGNSNLNPAERKIVKERLFGKEGGGVKEQFSLESVDWATTNVSKALYRTFVEKKQVEEEIELSYLKQLDESEDRKYKIRVTDKSGKAYVRYATREKITALRSNANIKSVEMTEHGDVVGGERKSGQQTAAAKGGGKKLDPVGKEDKDIDNDGDHDKSDKYLLKRRAAIGKSIRTRAESFLADGTISTEPKNKKKVTGEGVDNYKSGAVKVAPETKDEDPSVKAASRGIYAHKETDGTVLSEDEKKEEKKDMRGYYAKINMVRNKIRAMGAKNPCVIADPDEVEKSWDKGKKDDEVKEERTAADPGAPARMGRYDPKLPSGLTPTEGSQVKQQPTSKMGKEPLHVKPKKKQGKHGFNTGEKKPYPGYNPQKGVGAEYKP